MRELVGGKNTIGRTAAVLKSPIKRPLPFTFYFNTVLIVNIFYNKFTLHNYAEHIMDLGPDPYE